MTSDATPHGPAPESSTRTPSPLRIAWRALVRAVVLVALMQGQFWAWGAFYETPDANIGAGLIAFAVTVAVAGLWGLLDGVRQRSIGAPVATAVIAGVLFGVASTAVSASFEGLDLDAAVSSLLDVGSFLVGLAVVPGALGAAVGGAAAKPAPPVAAPEAWGQKPTDTR